MTGERECATGMPITPASPNPSCDMLRFHPRSPFGARPFYLVIRPRQLEGMTSGCNVNLGASADANRQPGERLKSRRSPGEGRDDI
jgi:hypothetical protein